MSYDVSIGDVSLNYTSNLAKLFYDHIPQLASRGGLHELDSQTGKTALSILTDAFDSIHATYHRGECPAAFRAHYDAPNGWGSTDGALLFLARIMAACAANPRKIVRVGA